MSNPLGKPDFIVGCRYRMVRKIGSGSFGDIYLGINVTNGEVSSLENVTIRLHYYYLLAIAFYPTSY